MAKNDPEAAQLEKRIGLVDFTLMLRETLLLAPPWSPYVLLHLLLQNVRAESEDLFRHLFFSPTSSFFFDFFPLRSVGRYFRTH